MMRIRRLHQKLAGYPYRLAVGQRVREMRDALALTQKQVGDLVGVSSGMVSMIETGRTSVPPERYRALADALGADRRDFAMLLLRNSDPWLASMLFDGT